MRKTLAAITTIVAYDLALHAMELLKLGWPGKPAAWIYSFMIMPVIIVGYGIFWTLVWAAVLMLLIYEMATEGSKEEDMKNDVKDGYYLLHIQTGNKSDFKTIGAKIEKAIKESKVRCAFYWFDSKPREFPK